jgi:hypothetical protein
VLVGTLFVGLAACLLATILHRHLGAKVSFKERTKRDISHEIVISIYHSLDRPVENKI